ncbi:lysophospholipid acyltransferase family protein [Acidocella sp. KAb 2-4]|uniref:lysophospholipid acyltransferase family protein n=1 Tax=Acidocella sp. KAb 2-4 TaxID=2885158 RepID=UPI001D07779B|nr:1-acyl-sn-glycerol-3-phosphate acyltransferase [Acidocella sp. KAb 2-4]
MQAVLLALPVRGKERFARAYWRGVAWIIGLRLRVLGEISTARPVLFAANHWSWVDIIALGAVLPGCFVAKGEVGSWPGIGLIAKLGRTIFVSRGRDTLAREQQDMAARMTAGDNVILFPEGTSSDGNRVLPFAAAFFSLAFTPAAPWVQPVTIVYDQLEGLPVRRADRAGIAWFGDMDLAPHAGQLLRRRSLRATIWLDPAIPPGTYKSRKSLSDALYARIAANAAALRQNRPPADEI